MNRIEIGLVLRLVLVTLIVGSVSMVVPLATRASLPESETSVLPDTPRGRVMSGWFQAFNSGDPGKMDEFQMSNSSEELLARVGVDQRKRMYIDLYGEVGALEPKAVLDDLPDLLSVLAANQEDTWLEVRLRFESGSNKIAGMMLRESSPPEKLPPSGPMSESEVLGGIRGKLDEMTQDDDFAGAVLIAQNGEPIFTEAFGLASREFSVPNRVNTKFNLGSINKIFTKVAVAQLLEQGRLSLDDELGAFLPDYPNKEAAEKVTVRDLVGMTSGIGDFFGERFQATPKTRLRDNRDYLPLFADQPLEFEPGTDSRYSNGGYVVLGLVIEKASGRGYYDYVREHIFEPLGMKDTDSYEADAIVPNLACGYTRVNPESETEGPLRSNTYTRPARGSSAGGGYSTVSDLLRFVNALISSELLPEEYAGWILGGPEPARSSKGDEQQGPRGAAFAGGAPGINSLIETGIPGGYTVIVMTNMDPPAAMNAGDLVRRWLGKIE
jgi:D-alanyl-D-alanine carboxypeptidase